MNHHQRLTRDDVCALMERAKSSPEYVDGPSISDITWAQAYVKTLPAESIFTSVERDGDEILLYSIKDFKNLSMISLEGRIVWWHMFQDNHETVAAYEHCPELSPDFLRFITTAFAE